LNPIGITKPRSFTPGLFRVSPSRTYSNEGPTGQRKIPVGLHFIVRPRHKASGAALGRVAQFALSSRPAYLPAAVPCVRQGLTRHHQISCRTFSCRWIASQRHSPRRIAKHLSGAGFCRCRRDFVTRFLLKNLVSICVIAFDVNFIEDRKSVAIGDF
jgi:hypothetical protein